MNKLLLALTISVFSLSCAFADINVSGSIRYVSPESTLTESVSEPSSPSEGDKWRNVETNELKVYTSGDWVLQNSNELALSSSDIQVLDDDDTITVDKSYIKVAGNGAAVTLDTNPAIEDGTEGKIIYIQGTSDTNTVTIINGVNTKLINGVSFTLGEDDTISLMYNGSVWVEQTRGDK